MGFGVDRLEPLFQGCCWCLLHTALNPWETSRTLRVLACPVLMSCRQKRLASRLRRQGPLPCRASAALGRRGFYWEPKRHRFQLQVAPLPSAEPANGTCVHNLGKPRRNAAPVRRRSLPLIQLRPRQLSVGFGTTKVGARWL